MSLLPLLAVVCSSFTFDAPRVLALPGNSHATPIVADLDGDGRNDLVVSNWEGQAAILYGDRAEPETLPWSVFGAGDVLGDARPDLFTSAGIQENLGGGRFAPYPSPTNGRFFARDFTGDGRGDLLVGSTPNKLLLLERRADGRLDSHPASDTGTYTPWSAAGDVDGDGRTELIGISGFNVRVFRHAGGGRFEAAATHEASAQVRLVETADLDRDGRDDILLYLQPSTARIEVLYGNGDRRSFSVGNYASEGDRLRIADYNDDGAMDVLVGHRDGYGDWVSIHFNDRSGALRQTTQFGVRSIYELAGGDVTNDGKTDLVLATALGYAVMPGLGNGLFFSPRYLGLKSPSVRHAAMDLDRNGIDEVVYYDGYRVRVAWNSERDEELDRPFLSGTPSLRPAPNEEFIAQSGNTAVAFAWRDGAWHQRVLELDSYGIVHAADFDGDAKNELVSIRISGNGYSIRVHGEQGVTFSTYVPAPVLHDQFNFVLDDFTGDGVPDLALSLTGTPQYPTVGGIPLRNGSIAIYAGNRNLSLTRIGTPIENESPRDLATGDFNGDGARDLAFTTYDNDARVIYGQAGSFTAWQTVVPGPSYNVRIAARDVNGDGITDLLGAKADAFTLLLGSRDGLAESGRWSAGHIGGWPLFARLTASEAPLLLMSMSEGAVMIETTCVQSRRRSVRH